MSFRSTPSASCGARVRGRARGFTLVELLVVIGIIALLISILLPSLNKARQQGQMIKCLSNIRSIQMAVTMYANENRQYVPAVNWGGGATNNGKVLAGWLYPTGGPASTERFGPGGFTGPMKETVIEQGALWPYLQTREIYRCPGHDRALVRGRTDTATSYLMNGAMNGYNRQMLYRITQFKSDDVCIWEADEAAGAAFNDGSSFPDESFIGPNATIGKAAFEVRHGKVSTLGFIGGHAETMLHDEVLKFARDDKGKRRNQFWCTPPNADNPVSKFGE